MCVLTRYRERLHLAPWERPLTEVEALAQPENAAMTWLEVLWALGTFERSARGWSLVAIEGSRPAHAEPRYRLALHSTGIRRDADSYAAFEQITAASEAGPEGRVDEEGRAY